MLPRHTMVTIKIQAQKCWLFLPAILLFLAGCAPPGPRALLAGKELLDAGKSQQATEKFKTATTLMPTNALAFNYLGLACHQSGQFAEAERAYRRALSLNHELAEAHFNLGCLFLAQSKLEQAKSELTAFTLRRANSHEGFLKLGTVQLRSRELSAAERSFNEALRLDANNPEALTGLGLAKLQRNRAGEAVQFFNRALRAHPEYRPALVNLAVAAQENLKDPALALRYYRQLLALKPPPENASKIQALVRTLEFQSNPPLTALPRSNAPALAQTPQRDVPKPPATNVSAAPAPKKQALAAIASPPQSSPAPSAPTNIVKVPPTTEWKPSTAPAVAARPATNQDSQVRSEISSVPPKPTVNTTPAPAAPLELVTLASEPTFKPGQDPLPANAGAAKRESRATNSGVATSQPPPPAPKRGLLQKINPARLFGEEKPAEVKGVDNSLPVTPREPVAASESSSAPEAISSPTRYSYKNPAKPLQGNQAEAERSYAQGVQAHNSHRLPEAMQAYRRAIQSDPAGFNAYYNLALAATSSGNLPLALSTYETALALRPDFLEARYNFALVLKQANYPLDAANELEKLLRTYPNDSRSHLALGNLYAQQLGKPALARQHYLKVLEMDPRNPQAGAIHYWLNDHPK